MSAKLRQAAGRTFRLEALAAERAALDELWLRDAITDEVHRPLQQLLDREESMLHGHRSQSADSEFWPSFDLKS